MSVVARTLELRTALRHGRQYGIVSDAKDASFHILKPDSFPSTFECGLGPVGELVDFYPYGATCTNCIRVVESQ